MTFEWTWTHFRREMSQILPSFPLSYGSWLQWLSIVVAHGASKPSPSGLQIGKQAVGVCQREGRRHRGGLEGEGMRNKWRIVMQTEEISGESFSLEAQIIHLYQRALVWQSPGAESYWSWIIWYPARNVTSPGWFYWKKEMSVSDQVPLYKVNMLNFLETNILQQQNWLWLPL